MYRTNRNSMLILVLLLSLFAFTVNCGTGKSDKGMFDLADEVSAPVGIEFDVTCPVNLENGLDWISNYDEKYLLLTNNTYGNSGLGIENADGMHTFFYKGLKKGNTNIYFELRRGDEIIQKQIVKIEIK